MVGERTGKVYKLGDPIHIAVAGVDSLTRTIDFVLYQEDEEGHVILPMEKKSRPQRIQTIPMPPVPENKEDQTPKKKDKKGKKKSAKRPVKKAHGKAGKKKGVKKA